MGKILDPNLEELAQFPTFKPKKVLTYANRQLIAREVELEKMRMVENEKAKIVEGKSAKEVKKMEKKEQHVPNYLKKLEAKNLKPKETVSFLNRVYYFYFLKRFLDN